jgi:hypothetical protein
MPSPEKNPARHQSGEHLRPPARRGAGLRSKALAYLRDHKVAIVRADPCEERARPVLVWAAVQGWRGLHKVRLRERRWTCHLEPCPGGQPREGRYECESAECAHVAAVQLVTGHPSLAARPAGQRRRAA